jgi:ArsR family metal-binding transcriptional regulator
MTAPIIYLSATKTVSKYAFRPLEIRIGILRDPSNAKLAARKTIDLVNRTWDERGEIAPDYRQWRLPSIYEIYRLLPGINCGACEYVTCLAFAAAIRIKEDTLEKCPVLLKLEFTESRQAILQLFR